MSGAPGTLGLVPGAVALSESGILVNGLCVTDLLSGFEVTGEEPGDAPGEPSPGYRGSGVPLQRLEAVRELVEEAMSVRAGEPELTSANPVQPRTVFPWGIGIAVSDVLVVGPDKEAAASYLRVMGFRARTVDATAALRTAGDLAAARAVVQDGGLPEESGDAGETAPVEVDPGPSDDLPVSGTDTGTDRAPGRRTGLLAVSAAVLVAAAVVAFTVVQPAGDGGVTAQEKGTAPAQSSSMPVRPAEPDTAPGPSPEGWREMHTGDGVPEDPAAGAGETARISVQADVPGWAVSETTAEREIWTSADEGMRVLVAAAPTPAGTQEELDAAVLRVLDGMDGTEAVNVTARSPVDYEEEFPESTTTWRVRLIDGHQVSVGCQYRGYSMERMEVCDRFTATARVR
ncbi:MAG: type VII secretion-associated protein [Mycobacteriaceae bacterium]|uniref:type VII secretion-associated protein n=1 Tax=Corynebacterium sp. TaxID=1720 RepID=UPI003F96316C